MACRAAGLDDIDQKTVVNVNLALVNQRLAAYNEPPDALDI